MTIKVTLQPDGELLVADDNDGLKNSDGSPALRRWSIRPEQIAAHRRDPAFDAALPAAIKAALDAPPAKA